VTELLSSVMAKPTGTASSASRAQVDVPLNAAGHAQAQRLGTRWQTSATTPSSPVTDPRARNRRADGRRWAMQPVPVVGLREQSFGVLEGLDVPTIKARHAELWHLWLEHRGDFALPGGESLIQFHARVIAAVRELAAASPGQRVAVVTHGGVLDMLWRTAHGLPVSGLRTCEIPNTGLNRLRWVNGTLHIEQWADAAHLVGLPEQANTAAGER